MAPILQDQSSPVERIWDKMNMITDAIEMPVAMSRVCPDNVIITSIRPPAMMAASRRIRRYLI